MHLKSGLDTASQPGSSGSDQTPEVIRQSRPLIGWDASATTLHPAQNTLGVGWAYSRVGHSQYICDCTAPPCGGTFSSTRLLFRDTSLTSHEHEQNTAFKILRKVIYAIISSLFPICSIYSMPLQLGDFFSYSDLLNTLHHLMQNNILGGCTFQSKLTNWMYLRSVVVLHSGVGR